MWRLALNSGVSDSAIIGGYNTWTGKSAGSDKQLSKRIDCFGLVTQYIVQQNKHIYLALSVFLLLLQKDGAYDSRFPSHQPPSPQAYQHPSNNAVS